MKTDSKVESEVLLTGTTLLRGQYMIEEPLMRGGFGVTYLAWDSLEREVVVKECFPQGLCCRVGDRIQPVSADYGRRYRSMLNHFLREARRLATLKHPNIVGVHQVFEENNTAYMALDLVEGDDLLTVAQLDPGRLTPDLIERSLQTVLEAMDHIHHEGILHRDISPDNILIGPDDHITLIDFGAARAQAGQESRMLTEILAVKDGYSPQEFYRSDAPLMPNGDLYSIGATFYRLITGKAPPHSQDRMAALAARKADPCRPLLGRFDTYAPGFLAAIDRAMSVLPEDRMQTAAEWLAEIRPLSMGNKTVPPVRIASELQRQITQLVQETNVRVDSAPVVRKTEPFKPCEKTIPPKPVDLFGNPIEDVQAWLLDQERQSREAEEAARAQAEELAAAERPQSILSRGWAAFCRGLS